MRLGVLFSGGKDSVFACFKAMEKHDIVCLISILPENKESYMFHTSNIHLVEQQAKALGIPIIIKTSKGEKEAELDDLKIAIDNAKKQYILEGIVTGAIESVYQSARIQKVCADLDLWCLNPLWQADQIEHLRELTAAGFKIIISGVFAEPFTKKWLGREIDEKAIKELEKLKKTHYINPAGEGGEIETLAIDGPIFKKRIEIVDAESKHSGNSGLYEIKETKLVEK